jgi:hypothetical protein
MNLFSRNKPADVILLMPVNLPEETLPKNKIRMMYCDVNGKVYTTLMEKYVYKQVVDEVEEREAEDQFFATLGIEIGPGNFAPLIVNINQDESWALSHSLEHALRSGIIPDVLHKHLKTIIQTGEYAHRKTMAAESREAKPEQDELAIPDVFPYYLENDIEFAMPEYKPEHRFPLLVLRSVHSSKKGRKYLVLDSDGDLAIVKVPFKLIEKGEKQLEEWSSFTGKPACLIVNRTRQGYSVLYEIINGTQKKALDALILRFSEADYEKSLPAAVQKVLDIAQETCETNSE